MLWWGCKGLWLFTLTMPGFMHVWLQIIYVDNDDVHFSQSMLYFVLFLVFSLINPAHFKSKRWNLFLASSIVEPFHHINYSIFILLNSLNKRNTFSAHWLKALWGTGMKKICVYVGASVNVFVVHLFNS